MEHISFELICRIADEAVSNKEMAFYLAHLESCAHCQNEVNLQKLLMKTAHQTNLVQPSLDFTKKVLNNIVPSKRRKLYEWLLENLGNVFATGSILAFVGYVYSVIVTNTIQIDKPITSKPISDFVWNFVKIIQDYVYQLVSFFTFKFPYKDNSLLKSNTIVFALLAIVVLMFIDKIVQRFFYGTKV